MSEKQSEWAGGSEALGPAGLEGILSVNLTSLCLLDSMHSIFLYTVLTFFLAGFFFF